MKSTETGGNLSHCVCSYRENSEHLIATAPRGGVHRRLMEVKEVNQGCVARTESGCR
jgi:hypothetical protein